MKDKTRKLIMRYRFFFILAVINAAVLIFWPVVGKKALGLTWENMLEMLSVIPPIFILLGLLDVWVSRDTMIRLMGEKSGWIGVLLAFFMGSAAAGPLYAAFPVAGVLMRKGSRLFNVFIFIGAWSTTKIPMLLFEASSMGGVFMATRLLIDIVGIVIIAWVMCHFISDEDKKAIYERAMAMK